MIFPLLGGAGQISGGVGVGRGVVAQSTLLNDIVAYWPMHEASGTRADSVASYDLADVNTVTQSVGKRGKASAHVGANKEVLGGLTDAAFAATTGSFTIAGWWKWTGTPGSNRVFARAKTGAGGVDYQVLLSSNVPRFYLYNASGTSETVTASTFGAANTQGPWYFLVCYYDATAGTIGISVNNSTPDTFNLTITPSATAVDAPLYFGGLHAFNTGYMTGRMCEWGFWSRVLTDDERTELYNYGLGATHPFSDVGPVLPTSFTRVENSATYDWAGAYAVVGTDLQLWGREGGEHIDIDGSLQRWAYSGGSWAQDAIYDSAYDDRNSGGGKVPATSTLLWFFREFTPTGSVTEDVKVLRSTDGGTNWTTISGLAAPAGYTTYAPYGPLVELPSGNLLQSFYGNDGGTNEAAYTLLSSDDGATWGTVVKIGEAASGPSETAICYIDGASDAAARLIAVARDVTSQYTSSDGGGTWSAGVSISTRTATANPITPWLHKYNDYLILLYTDRGNSEARYLVGVADSVFTDANCWSDARSIYTSTANMVEGDFGNMIIFEYGGALHVAFYDDDTGAGGVNILTSL